VLGWWQHDGVGADLQWTNVYFCRSHLEKGESSAFSPILQKE
jgi:hypothetical protein